MKEKNQSKVPAINENIRFDTLHVISSEGENLGVLPKSKALRMAKDIELDLVLITEKGSEGYPIAKIMDYGKALYAKKKQVHEAKKHHKTIQVKELKIRPKIGEHDFQTKINQAIQFLKDGKHVKITLIFRGREAEMLSERGSEMFAKIDSSFSQAGLSKVSHEKDLRISGIWSRIYLLKN